MPLFKNSLHSIAISLFSVGVSISGYATIKPSYDFSAYANAVVSQKDLPHSADTSNLPGITMHSEMVNFRDVWLRRKRIVVDMEAGGEIVDTIGPDFRVYESDEYFRNHWQELGYGLGIDAVDITGTNQVYGD